MTRAISLRDVTKTYPRHVVAVDRLSLILRDLRRRASGRVGSPCVQRIEILPHLRELRPRRNHLHDGLAEHLRVRAS